MRHIAWTLGVLLTFAAAGSTMGAEKQKPATEVLGGKEIVDTIAAAKTVTVYRLKGETLKSKPEEYEVTAGPTKLDAKVARELATIITAYATYDHDTAPACEPVFGVRTTFTHVKSVIDVVYCFDCDLLAVYHNGERVGDGYFAPGRGKLVAIMKQLFPKDDVIQKLK